jgi:hypothetical protein
MITTTRGLRPSNVIKPLRSTAFRHLFLYADRQPPDAPFVDKMSVLALKNAKFTWLPA